MGGLSVGRSGAPALGSSGGRSVAGVAGSLSRERSACIPASPFSIVQTPWAHPPRRAPRRCPFSDSPHQIAQRWPMFAQTHGRLLCRSDPTWPLECDLRPDPGVPRGGRSGDLYRMSISRVVRGWHEVRSAGFCPEQGRSKLKFGRYSLRLCCGADASTSRRDPADRIGT